MKKLISAILACAILVAALLTLSSCGGQLSGTYKGEIFDLKFSGENVTVSLDTFNATVTGTYKITENDDGTQTINFDFMDDELAQDGSIIYTLIDVILEPNLKFVEDGDTIKIGEFTFTEK